MGKDARRWQRRTRLEMERGGMVDTGEAREYLDRKEREGTKKEGKGKEGPRRKMNEDVWRTLYDSYNVLDVHPSGLH